MASNAGKTVRQILKGKRATIKTAALDPGSPSWGDILDLSWEELEKRANRRQAGYQSIKKLLQERRFDK